MDERNEPGDPLTELVAALHADGRPSLPWVLAWSAGGREPLAAAWAASDDGDAMFAVLQLAPSGDARWDARKGEAFLAALRSGRCARGLSLRDAADAIRRTVPVPPTLTEVLDSLGTEWAG